MSAQLVVIEAALESLVIQEPPASMQACHHQPHHLQELEHPGRDLHQVEYEDLVLDLHHVDLGLPEQHPGPARHHLPPGAVQYFFVIWVVKYFI